MCGPKTTKKICLEIQCFKLIYWSVLIQAFYLLFDDLDANTETAFLCRNSIKVLLFFWWVFNFVPCHQGFLSLSGFCCCGAQSSSCTQQPLLLLPLLSPAMCCSLSSKTVLLHTWQHDFYLQRVFVSVFTLRFIVHSHVLVNQDTWCWEFQTGTKDTWDWSNVEIYWLVL